MREIFTATIADDRIKVNEDILHLWQVNQFIMYTGRVMSSNAIYNLQSGGSHIAGD
jgi:hypothetical protein